MIFSVGITISCSDLLSPNNAKVGLLTIPPLLKDWKAFILGNRPPEALFATIGYCGPIAPPVAVAPPVLPPAHLITPVTNWKANHWLIISLTLSTNCFAKSWTASPKLRIGSSNLSTSPLKNSISRLISISRSASSSENNPSTCIRSASAVKSAISLSSCATSASCAWNPPVAAVITPEIPAAPPNMASLETFLHISLNFTVLSSIVLVISYQISLSLLFCSCILSISNSFSAILFKVLLISFCV